MNSVLWEATNETKAKSKLTLFAHHAARAANAPSLNMTAQDYQALHSWSVHKPADFWNSFWDFAEILGQKGNKIVATGSPMEQTRFFPEGSLNYAENVLRRWKASPEQALTFWSEDRLKKQMTGGELYLAVARCAQALKKLGVDEGDRVAAFLPNGPEAIVAMLATASLGAIWSSASPDFGVQGVLDRFGQIDPKVLFVVDGYWYAGKPMDCREKNSAIAEKLPTLKAVVQTSIMNDRVSTPVIAWDQFLGVEKPELRFTTVKFNHPLCILFSSGTTGVPKCIVHGHGGTLIQHMKEHQLHGDVHAGDRLFYFTTLGWMMWNWMVTGLASGAQLLLYDGSPFAAGGNILFDYAAQARCTHFGTSAKFIDAAAKQGLSPMKTHDLSSVRALFSTGSPLVPEGFDWVYTQMKKDIHLASISGGTDIVSCFVLGNIWSPVLRGEIQGPGLGLDVQVFDDEGRKIPAGQPTKGELVCCQAFPSMPVQFWRDDGGKKYHDAYFARFENIWCHGDFVQETEQHGFIIFGRSDAVLNPGGVRIGTAEIYRQVEKLPEVLESIVIGQNWQHDVRVVLFVKLAANVNLTEDLQKKIRDVIRSNTTPRHVPAKILSVTDIPRTKSGKLVELAVRNVVHGDPVKNTEAMANPESLDYFRNRKELAE